MDIKNLCINEKKILDYLQNNLKLSLVQLREDHSIHIYSSVSNIETLLEFIKPLHYWANFIGVGGRGFISINPR